MGHRPPRPYKPEPFRRYTTVEEAKKEFVRGNIDAFELERRVVLALEKEPHDKIIMPLDQEDGMDMDQAIRIGKGVVLGAVAVTLILVIFAIVLMGVAGLVYEIAHSV